TPQQQSPAPIARVIDAAEGKWLRSGQFRDGLANQFDDWFNRRFRPKADQATEVQGMSVQGKRGEGHNLQAALDELHADVYRHNMAPYWVVDRSVTHDHDRQVMQGRKAIPFIWKYKEQIEPLLYRSAELITTETSERRSLVLVNPGMAPQRA